MGDETGCRITCLVATLCLAQSPSTAQDAAYRRMLESKKTVSDYLNQRAREITARAGAEVSDRATWDKVKEQRREELRDMLGLLPWPARTPLNVKITGKIDRGDFIIEKIAFESMPKFYVTGNLYIPKNRKGPLPSVIYVCGHSDSPYGAKTQYQRHGISFAKNGYVAFMLDPIQIAEIFSPHHGVAFEEMYDWYSRGYTPAGVETWNAIRAIDYLETRTEVDRNRIGMTGRSGGAAMSWFTGAVDTRVKVVSPIMGISTYAANLPANTQALHCDCMFPINFYMQDMMHQAALIAPRPLLFGEGKKDALFPVPGYMEVKEKIDSLYRGYNHPASFDLVEVDTAHADSDFLRERVIHWFDQYLMDIPERKLDMAYSNTPDEQLAVFGGKPPADARNGRVWEYFTTRPHSPEFKTLDAWKNRRAEMLPNMHHKVFRAMASELRNLRLEPVGPAGRFTEMKLASDETVPVERCYTYLRRKAREIRPFSTWLRTARMRLISIRCSEASTCPIRSHGWRCFRGESAKSRGIRRSGRRHCAMPCRWARRWTRCGLRMFGPPSKRCRRGMMSIRRRLPLWARVFPAFWDCTGRSSIRRCNTRC